MALGILLSGITTGMMALCKVTPSPSASLCVPPRAFLLSPACSCSHLSASANAVAEVHV